MRRLTGIAAAVLLLICTFGASAARAGTSGVLTLRDPASGEELIVTNNGVCGQVNVQEVPISGKPFQDVGVSHDLAWALDAKCRVSLIPFPTSKSEPIASTSASGSPPSSAPIVTPFASSGSNVIHSSQTILDCCGITVGRFQYSHLRTWDGFCCSYLNWQWWMTQDTAVWWNHNVGNPHSNGYDSNWTSGWAQGYGQADFHSDFLWCNFQAGQNFSEYNTIRSYWDGGYDAFFSDSTLCSGLHHATRKAADNQYGNIW